MVRAAAVLIILVGAVSTCQGAGERTPAATAPPSGPASPPAERPTLPIGFPVLPGATAQPLPPDDLGLIARWSTERVGAFAYDFYSEALPAAGYVVEGRYPGDTGAIIRFTGPSGQLWQLTILGLDPRTAQIEVRLDRP